MQFYDRARNENRLFNLYGPYGSITSPQKEVKNILSPLNEMQFSDRVRIENRLFNLYGSYGSYGSTTCETPFTPVRSENIWSTLNDMQFSDRVRIENRLFNLYGSYGSYGSTTCETPFTPVRSENIWSTLNDMQFSDRIGLPRSDEQYRSKRGIFNLYWTGSPKPWLHLQKRNLPIQVRPAIVFPNLSGWKVEANSTHRNSTYHIVWLINLE